MGNMFFLNLLLLHLHTILIHTVTVLWVGATCLVAVINHVVTNNFMVTVLSLTNKTSCHAPERTLQGSWEHWAMQWYFYSDLPLQRH